MSESTNKKLVGQPILPQILDLVSRITFRGLSFYDARRWGYIYDGRTGCVVVGPFGVTPQHPLNVNATINYNYLDYWDVPDNDIAFNPPAAGSDPTTNPN